MIAVIEHIEVIIKKLYLLLLFPFILLAEHNVTEPLDWGLGMVIRTGSVPFNNPAIVTPDTVTSAVPMLYFKSDYIYMDGFEGGFKYEINKDWRVALITRLRFSDIPKDFQNEFQSTTYDFGPQLRYKFNQDNFLDLEVMTHIKGHNYANLSYKGDFNTGGFEIKPYLTFRAKSSGFNSLYYAIEPVSGQKIQGGIDTTLGIDTKYHLVSNLYLLAGADVTILDKAAKDARAVDKGYEYGVYAGLGLFKEPPKDSHRSISTKPYIRIAHNWATHYDLDQIIGGSFARDEYHHQLTSVFYGHPLTDNLLGLPIEVYLTPGFALHHRSEVQGILREYDIGFKAYYTIPLPIRIRLGAAEGLSYINEVSWIERTDLIEDGDQAPSKLLNYLDFSVGVNLGDLFFNKSMEEVWLGYNIHHRSGIFSESAQFGRVNGGSNYPGVYVQIHW